MKETEENILCSLFKESLSLTIWLNNALDELWFNRFSISFTFNESEESRPDGGLERLYSWLIHSKEMITPAH